MERDKISKQNALKKYRELKKLLKNEQGDFQILYENLRKYPDFQNYVESRESRGSLVFNYANMTLKILVKNGIIYLQDEIQLWDESGIGFIGDFTTKTLRMETSSELD